MAGRESEKGHRYTVALDNARCQNKWEEVPELIRKVTKHASQKTCFLDVASAEYQITTHIHRNPAPARPSSSSASSLPELIPSLLSTIDKADGSDQEVFQAQVCLGWVHHTLNEPGLAAARLPKDFEDTLNTLANVGEDLSPWTKVCLVKGCYIKGFAQNMVTGSQDALQTFNSLAPWLSSHGLATSSNSPQFLHWSEKLLAEGASIASDEVRKNLPAVNDELIRTALGLFRSWSSHPYIKTNASSYGLVHESSAKPHSKSAIWKSYYDLLSAILRNGLSYTAPADGPERPQLASEIRHVESVCEANLLRDVKFPTADSDNKQVEAWVEQVIQNWEEFCGPTWLDEELGEGGQNAISKGVLDILYRAATKTYHSYLILRRLFHVHAALAEFDLAFKALDSYIEIVTGAKERAEKAGPYGELERDGTFMQTLSEGITILCSFGSSKEAEKARELVLILKNLINKYVQESEEGQVRKLNICSNTISPRDVSAAYRAIGVGLAHWASWTPVNEDRDDMRAEAIECLERSIAPEFEDEGNYSSLYALALLLAESRDLDAAIDYVKSALASKKQPESMPANFGRERDLVPLWHLLALLLSAKQEFDIAERSCEAAFEQFPAAVTSLAHSDRRPTKPQQNTQEHADLKHGLIDRLRSREKERIIETRMTQLAFVEVLEGPEAALNHSEQLLGLFGALFRKLDLEQDENLNAKIEQLSRPKSSTGTVKSFRGSIFGRHRNHHRLDSSYENKIDSQDHLSSQKKSVSNGDVAAPAIRVIDEEKPTTNDNHSALGRSDSRKIRKRPSSVKKTDGSTEHGSDPVNGEGVGFTAPDALETNGTRTPHEETRMGVQSAKQSLPPMAHNVKHTRLEPPVGHSKQPPEQDVRLPKSYGFESPTRAITKFPHTQAQKHALCILVKIWLLIAGLYRRASSFEDASEACEEAAKHVKRIEAIAAASDASARSFQERGWATPKSSDELWADIYAEKGLLANAQSHPHEALEYFEEALMYNADHPKATISLANLLLDVWDRKIPLQPEEPGVEVGLSKIAISLLPGKQSLTARGNDAKRISRSGLPGPGQLKAEKPPSPPVKEEEPKLINRIAARERAYSLLSALTKRGTSWDNSEAWFALSRAYEAVGQTQKLKEVLWWCIELEDRRPIRHWSNVGSGLYVL